MLQEAQLSLRRLFKRRMISSKESLKRGAREQSTTGHNMTLHHNKLPLT